MGYIDLEEVLGRGYICDTDNAEKYLRLAHNKIDELTFNRIKGIGFENLTDFQQECIKNAVCEQAEFYVENGTEGSTIKNYSLAGVSVTMSDEKEHDRMGVSATVYNYLKMTGLMSRRI